MSNNYTVDVAARRLARVADRVRAELLRAVPLEAQRIAAAMRLNAPKGVRTTLANSIGAVQEDASGLSWLVYSPLDYATWVSRGRKPGKGLPRFFDPASASIVAWLEGNPSAAGPAGPVNLRQRRGRLGSRRRTAAELELRDRYMALSRAVKLHGLKANPYVALTAAQEGPRTRSALVDAVRRGAAGYTQGGAA